jgi:signal peptidase
MEMERNRLSDLTDWVSRITNWALMAALGGLGLLMLAAVGPAAVGHQNFIVLGGSMEPSIQVGSVVVTRRVSPDELLVGDVITYVNRANDFVTHRIVEVFEDELGIAVRTKGDTNNTDDSEPVRTVNILGRVRYGVPLAGYVLHFGGEDQVRLPLMALAALVVIWQLFGLHTDGTTKDASASSAQARRRTESQAIPSSFVHRPSSIAPRPSSIVHRPSSLDAAAARLAQMITRFESSH